MRIKLGELVKLPMATNCEDCSEEDLCGCGIRNMTIHEISNIEVEVDEKVISIISSSIHNSSLRDCVLAKRIADNIKDIIKVVE